MLYLAQLEDGWWYRTPAVGEYAKWKAFDAHPTRGSFATAEDALRDAAVAIDLSRVSWQQMAAAAPDTEFGRAAAAMAASHAK